MTHYDAPLVVGDLFSGIGGFSLAARWMGWRTAWFSEIDPWAERVLAKNFPGVPNLGDITRIDFAAVPYVDILTAGFPCTDISVAGKGRGLAGPHSGLWRNTADAIRCLRPRYVVVENVAHLLHNGFDTVLGDLAALGYHAQWDVRSPSRLGSPQERERLYLTAWREWEPTCTLDDFDRCDACDDYWCPRCVSHADACACLTEGRVAASDDWCYAKQPWGDVAYPLRERGRGWELAWEHAIYADARRETVLASGARQRWATGPTVCGVAYGLRGRLDRLRGLGNAIVPEEAYATFQWIAKHDAEYWGA